MLFCPQVPRSNFDDRHATVMQDYFASWPQEGTVDLFEKIAELIIMTASRTLMGEIVLHPISVNPYRHFPLQEHCMASYAGSTLKVALRTEAVQRHAFDCIMLNE